MSIRAVLFDLDGTLVDSIADIASCGNEVLESMGCQALPVGRYRAFLGDGAANLARKVLPAERRDTASIERFLLAFGELYRARWKTSASLYEGVPEMLSALQERGACLAVLSNKKEEFTKLFVSELLPQWRFDAVCGESSGRPLKPDPTAALHIADELGIAPSKWLFVGDSEIDVETARRAGMAFIGVEWGFRSRAELVAAGAVHTIRSPIELLQFIAEKK
jgi:phosphoglycolate phosphatase